MNRACFANTCMTEVWEFVLQFWSNEYSEERKAERVTQVAAVSRCAFRAAWFAVKIWQKGTSWLYVLLSFILTFAFSQISPFRYTSTGQHVKNEALIIITELQSVCWIINLWLIIYYSLTKAANKRFWSPDLSRH